MDRLDIVAVGIERKGGIIARVIGALSRTAIVAAAGAEGGRMEGMDPLPGHMTVVQARAPLAELMTYARSLSSMTGGQGSYNMEFSHYEQVPPYEQQKIVAAAQMKHDDE